MSSGDNAWASHEASTTATEDTRSAFADPGRKKITNGRMEEVVRKKAMDQ
jgi:hypothetical protein